MSPWYDSLPAKLRKKAEETLCAFCDRPGVKRGWHVGMRGRPMKQWACKVHRKEVA
jgi:hypothetical protein